MSSLFVTVFINDNRVRRWYEYTIIRSKFRATTNHWLLTDSTAEPLGEGSGAGGRHRRRVINVLVGYVALRGHLPTTPTTKLY